MLCTIIEHNTSSHHLGGNLGLVLSGQLPATIGAETRVSDRSCLAPRTRCSGSDCTGPLLGTLDEHQDYKRRHREQVYVGYTENE